MLATQLFSAGTTALFPLHRYSISLRCGSILMASQGAFDGKPMMVVGSPNWASAIDQACEAAKVDHKKVKASIQMMAAPLATLFKDARELGIDKQFLTPLEKTVENVLSQLEKL